MSVHSKRGFTLVELLVVISIIAILSTIGMTVFTGVQKSARDAKRRADLKAISNALEIYRITGPTGKYPVSTWNMSTAANPWIPVLNSSYMVDMPRDPINSGGSPWDGSGKGYTYGYFAANYNSPTSSNGDWFMLVAHLESPNSNDKKTKCTTPDGNTFGSTDTGAGNIYKDNFFVCNQQ